MPECTDSLPRASRRVRAASAALLDADSATLLARVQDMLCETTRAQIVRALSATPLSVSELAHVIGRGK